MAILPIQVARVSNLLQAGIATQSLNTTQNALLVVQNELSTGKRVNVASDDPSAAAIIQQLQKTLDLRTGYAANISQAQGQLGVVDSTLNDVNSLLIQAQQVASANVGSTVSADQRKSASVVVDSILNQMLSMANTQYNGSYVFGGDKASDAPYQTNAAGVQFNGGTSLLQNSFGENASLTFQVGGADVFGGAGGVVSSQTDLTPSLLSAQRISDLRGVGGTGVHLGIISISNGTVSQNVDLSAADNVGDIVSAINNAAIPGVTAGLGTNGLALTATGGANITVNEVSGGSTAANLGILTTAGGGANVPVNGAAIQPTVTAFTPLSALRSGSGVDPTGFTISNGQTTATISISAGDTVQDLLNKINGSNTGAKVQINSAGTGLDIYNTVQGSKLSIAENGGTTATDLGIRSFGPLTPLANLNGGKGVGTVAGNDFSLTDSAGAIHNVDLNNVTTVQDVINQINTAGGGAVTATFSTTGNGIVLKDTAGGAGTLKVTPLNFSTAASDLGLTVPAVGTTITGADVNQVTTPGVFTNLQKLRDALISGDSAAITAATEGLKANSDHSVEVRGAAGARLQELQSRQSQLDGENVTTKTLLSHLQDTDFTAAITQFQTLQTSLQATLQTTGKTLHMSLLDYLA